MCSSLQCVVCFAGEVFFFQAEDGIRYLVRSGGLGDVYKRQGPHLPLCVDTALVDGIVAATLAHLPAALPVLFLPCLLYTSDAADERSSVDLGGRRILKKKTRERHRDG